MKSISVAAETADIQGYVYDGANGTPLVILLPGIRGLGYPHRIDWIELARRIASANFKVIAVNFRGQGGSGGKFSIHNALVDLRAVVEHAIATGLGGAENIGLWGMCIGGLVGMYYASFDKRIKSIAAWETPLRYDYENTHEMESRIQKAIENGVRIDDATFSIPYNAEDVIENIEQDILIAGGTVSGRVKLYELKRLFKKADKGRMEIIEGAEHRMDPNHRYYGPYADLCIRWFKDTLRDAR